MRSSSEKIFLLLRVTLLFKIGCVPGHRMLELKRVYLVCEAERKPGEPHPQARECMCAEHQASGEALGVEAGPEPGKSGLGLSVPEVARQAQTRILSRLQLVWVNNRPAKKKRDIYQSWQKAEASLHACLVIPINITKRQIFSAIKGYHIFSEKSMMKNYCE